MYLSFSHSAIAVLDDSPSLHLTLAATAKTPVKKSALLNAIAPGNGFDCIELAQELKIMAGQQASPFSPYYGIELRNKQTGPKQVGQDGILPYFGVYFYLQLPCKSHTISAIS